MQKYVMTFDNGKVQGVHCEALGLIGEAKIERASTVEFDETKQVWVASIKKKYAHKKPSTFSHKERAMCIEWEINYLNERSA